MSAIATTSTFEGESRSSLEYELVDYFERLVQESEDEVFEDGMESNFSRGLVSKVLEHGMPTLVVIEQVILAQSTNAEVLGETLVQIGAIDDPKTHDRRLTILIEALESEDVRIRDAASLGLEIHASGICYSSDRNGNGPRTIRADAGQSGDPDQPTAENVNDALSAGCQTTALGGGT